MEEIKKYILKIKDNDIYLHGMLMGGKPFFDPILTFDEKRAGIFEEDEANIYLEALNKGIFIWEKVGKNI